LAGERRGDLGLPLRRVRLKTLGEGGLVGLTAGLVKAEFDDRQVGMGEREVVVKPGLGQIQFDLVEGFERRAKVGEDQVALVAELRKKRGLDGGAWAGLGIGLRGAYTFQAPKRCLGLGGNLLAFALRTGAPGLPIEAEELVEQEGAFQSQRDQREIGLCVHLQNFSQFTPSS